LLDISIMIFYTNESFIAASKAYNEHDIQLTKI